MHGNIRVSSLFTSESGEWKLGGFEILSSMKDDEAIIYVCLGYDRSFSRYDGLFELDVW